jgi:antitoxin component YwqK of YwqJK toxin-antitoxin module
MKLQFTQAWVLLAMAFPATGYSFFDCPFGATLVGDPPPKSTEQYCQKQDKAGNMVRHGKYTRWARSGQVEEKAYYANGKLDGIRETFFAPQGVLNEREVRKEGELTERTVHSLDGTWNKSTWEGPSSKGANQQYYASGVLKEKCPHENGKLHGLCEGYDEAGKTIWAMQYDQDKPVKGTRVDVFGDSKSITTVSETGDRTVENFDGGVLIETRKLDRLNNGTKTDWHPNGKIACLTTLKNGAPVGVSKFWNPDGKLIGSKKSFDTVMYERVKAINEKMRGGSPRRKDEPGKSQ